MAIDKRDILDPAGNGGVNPKEAQTAGFKTISDTVKGVTDLDKQRQRDRTEAFKAQTDFNKAGMESSQSPEEKREFVQEQNENYRRFQESTDADAERTHGTIRGALNITGHALMAVATAAVGTGIYLYAKKK